MSQIERDALDRGRRYDVHEILRQLKSCDDGYVAIDQVMYYEDTGPNAKFGRYVLSLKVRAPQAPVPQAWVSKAEPQIRTGYIYYRTNDGVHFQLPSSSGVSLHRPRALTLIPRPVAR